jgi:hypothetical protein
MRLPECFFNALRPGGAAVIDTINVQGKTLRDGIEDSVLEAGFYLPFSATERWYRDQLESTGIVYGMVLGRPHIPAKGRTRPGTLQSTRSAINQYWIHFAVSTRHG